MNHLDHLICKTQKSIYEYMAKNQYDMKTFSDAYLCSDFCNNEMDSSYSIFQLEFCQECADNYLPEIEYKLSKTNNVNIDVHLEGNIGYIYRQLFIETSISSKELQKIIPYEEMKEFCYQSDHYNDDLIDEILQKYNIKKKKFNY